MSETALHETVENLKQQIEDVQRQFAKREASYNLAESQVQEFINKHGRILTHEDMKKDYLTVTQFGVVQTALTSQIEALSEHMRRTLEQDSRRAAEDRATLMNIAADLQTGSGEVRSGLAEMRRELQDLTEKTLDAWHTSRLNRADINRLEDREAETQLRLAKAEALDINLETLVGQAVHGVENAQITLREHERRLGALERWRLESQARLDRVDTLDDYVKTGNELRRLSARTVWRSRQAVTGVGNQVSRRWHQIVEAFVQHVAVRVIVYVLGVLGLGGLATLVVEWINYLIYGG